MYVARRAFRNYNQMILPGSIVEPGSVKWFKTRLKDRIIVEVNAHNFDEWNAYFKGKFGISLTKETPVETPKEAPKEEPKKEIKVVKVVTVTKN